MQHLFSMNGSVLQLSAVGGEGAVQKPATATAPAIEGTGGSVSSFLSMSGSVLQLSAEQEGEV